MLVDATVKLANAISIPVIGEGLLAQGIGLSAAGLVFAGAVALLAAVVLVLVRAGRDDG